MEKSENERRRREENEYYSKQAPKWWQFGGRANNEVEIDFDCFEKNFYPRIEQKYKNKMHLLTQQFVRDAAAANE